ncbi:AcrR family transcriptional regulator [Amycolatopsis bartoniae]|uniref:TetR family transcriptional regulator n=1 Tax=Amycolatopsis bartoniae TaxID=941986 RepID=A0A8H9M713_9PSEU|nr:TetR/AcrR family transcriptional regulator [Amycolatopsis bartoniae]MBB2938545.1 AcrR family transcriptional regulator [Amycolatopsis bartoniae]TVT10315.1 TetR/AcrR family transcriptional regulator [Amycolatopsis bartoniae]GHF70243.1 TetR family transcriptional regulator [Amycolatopsis bartoniae]
MATKREASGGAVLRQQVTEAITEAAFAELAETGYARTSMEAVARRAGVGKAALYRRWPSKQAMLTELIRDKVTATLPPTPATGSLRGDLRELLTTFRGQLTSPHLTRIGAGLLAEAGHDPALAEILETWVSTPRRAAARAVLQNAIERGELPPGLDLELGTDLLIAPLAFRMLVVRGHSDDGYLARLAAAIEAALQAAVC